MARIRRCSPTPHAASTDDRALPAARETDDERRAATSSQSTRASAQTGGAESLRSAPAPAGGHPRSRALAPSHAPAPAREQAPPSPAAAEQPERQQPSRPADAAPAHSTGRWPTDDRELITVHRVEPPSAPLYLRLNTAAMILDCTPMRNSPIRSCAAAKIRGLCQVKHANSCGPRRGRKQP